MFKIITLTMKRISLLFILIMILTGCRDKPAGGFVHSDILKESSPRHLVLADIVNGKYQKADTSISDLEDDLVISYIALETTEKSILGKVRNCKFVGDSILLSDHNSFYMFDHNGRFVWKVNNEGRGPGEYSGIGNIAIDRWRKEIIISCSEFARHYIYDYSGVFVEDLDLSPARGYPVKVIDSATYLVQSVTPDANPWAWVVTRDGIVHHTFSEYETPSKVYDDGRSSSYINQRKIGEFLNGYYLWQSDTVWHLNSSFAEKKAILTIDSRIKSMEAEVFHPVYQRNVSTGGERKRHYIYDLGSHHGNVLFLSYFFLQRTLLYDTSNGTFYLYPTEGYNDDNDNGPPVNGLSGTPWPHLSVIYPLEILNLDPEKIRKDSELLKIYNTIKPEDNPVVRIINRRQPVM